MSWTFHCTCGATSAFPTPRIIAELLAIEHLARHKDDTPQTILFREATTALPTLDEALGEALV